MSKPNWTEPQKAAIEDRGGGLLVSAAAGSGKTAVLVERVVSIICNKDNPIDVDRLLTVTFSNAAAAEMRQRIDTRLSKMILDNPENYYLQRQQNLLSSAPIKTVHAFCMDLIRENFQNLSISPDFAIMDEKELEVMEYDAVSEVIEEFYSNDESGGFSELVELLSTGRDDKRLIDTVFKIYNFARSHPFYEEWLNQKLEMYNNNILAVDTVWGKTLIDYTKETLDYCKYKLEQSREYLIGDETLEKAYLPAWESDLAQINNCLDYLNDNDWDSVVNMLRTFSFMSLKSVRGEDEYKEKAKIAREQTKKLIQSLGKKYLNATTKEFKKDIEDLKPKIETLFNLVKTFGKNLDNRKQQAKKLDFSDLEHFALQLLVTKEVNGYKTTTQAEEIASNYTYVLVDEYQDTNEVQDLIFTSLSGGGDRLFMVGDVKQSIYSFRLAMPEIFIKKKEVFSKYNKFNYPATINLDTNFRSRNQVTQGVNYIFKQIMSRKIGEIDYTIEESLKSGGKFPDQPLAEPELMIVNCENYKGQEDSTYLEAIAVAQKIKKMLEDNYQVAAGDNLRSAVPGDFCILMRSPRSRAEVYIKALQEQGINSKADNSGGFFEAREVSAIVNLLKVLDNPLLDIELVGVMLSSLFSFSDDDIAEIRFEAKHQSFYLAVKNSAQNGNKKCSEMLEIFNELRYFASSHSSSELILEIYRLTHWLEIARTMPIGEGRQSNLLLLVEYARYYDSMGYKGLGGFVALISRVQDQGGDFDSASSTGKNNNVVEIMSVHRSKGLEFPIVILADSSRHFNKRDLYETTLLHSSHGFACMRRNNTTLSQYPTIPMGAIRLEMQKTMLSEEMRILYVALTRAKEKLIISASIKDNVKNFINNLGQDLSKEKLPAFMVGEANSYAEWVIMSLLHHPSCEKLRELGELNELTLLPDTVGWKIDIIEGKEESKENDNKPKVWKEKADLKLLTTFKKKMDYVYPNLIGTRVPNKISVSDAIKNKEKNKYQFTRRPKVLSEQKLSPTERGNALHKYMQFANYENSTLNLSAEINRMRQDEFLSKAETESLSEQALADFFSSALAKRIFHSQKVYRELRFVTEFGKEELMHIFEEIDDDNKIILQGVADCVFVENNKAFIVDYKTDRVSTAEQLVERYKEQLLLYKKILAKTLDIPIGGCILYSFALSQSIEI